MLSVLIPTYNHCCYPLAAALQRQLAASGEAHEVIVADDGSRDQVSVISNLKINELPNCRYIRRTENVGRAAIRNFLVSEACGEWLLFLDNDARVITDDFVQRYLDAIRNTGNTDMIVGGMVHPERLPSPDVTLRYCYEKAADSRRSAKERSLTPYQHLTFFNLCVRKSVMEAVPFDEDCREYGYEDALLGVELRKCGVNVLHIDNPLEHTGLEKNAVYLSKVETALRTLHSLGDKMVPYSHVGKAAARLEGWHGVSLFLLVYKLSKPLLRRNLLGRNPSLNALKAYKLGYFLSL